MHLALADDMTTAKRILSLAVLCSVVGGPIAHAGSMAPTRSSNIAGKRSLPKTLRRAAAAGMVALACGVSGCSDPPPTTPLIRAMGIVEDRIAGYEEGFSKYAEYRIDSENKLVNQYEGVVMMVKNGSAAEKQRAYALGGRVLQPLGVPSTRARVKQLMQSLDTNPEPSVPLPSTPLIRAMGIVEDRIAGYSRYGDYSIDSENKIVNEYEAVVLMVKHGSAAEKQRIYALGGRVLQPLGVPSTRERVTQLMQSLQTNPEPSADGRTARVE